MNTDGALEQLLESVGDNGRYQTYLIWLFFLPLSIICPFSILSQSFQSSVPDHWCHVPGKPDDISIEQWKNLTIPWTIEKEKETLSKCKQFSIIQSQEDYNKSLETVDCRNGWDFDHTWYDRTLPTDMEWVCEKDSYPARWLSTGLGGRIVGTLLFNGLSDQFGRKGGTILATQCYAIFAIARLYVRSEWSILILMFLSSMAFPALIEIPWIFVVEQVSKEGRSRVTTISFSMWAVGGCLLSLLAWYTRDWVKLGIVTSVPFVAVILHWWFFPESPRWLLSKGRVKESFKAFQKIARINGKVCPDDLEDKLEKLAAQAKKQSGNKWISFTFLEVLKHPLVRKRTLVLSACLTCNVLVYYGIVYNASNMSGNEFLNFFYLMISEIPGNLVGWICAETFGRRASAAAFFFFASVTAFVIAFISFLESWIEVFLVVICKGLGNVCFLVLYIQMAEIQPTSHRASASGICSIVSAIFGTIAPYIAYSRTAWLALPYVLLTVIGLMGTVSALLLPETLGENLPQTLSDAKNFLPDQSFWSYKGWRPGRKKHSKTNQEEKRGNINLAMSENNLSDGQKAE